ncbi:hypothetical protein M409DRAFT_49413 [Zasmidium cellare ATCC 36951]|uniref:D-isomer specific 2-hydroxyacid dehydrogenase NAD-binding domain-containing protein n=1 Tax=Zasmidium cellare ATCC 36951 TaxID=1080233 RepID=A0A6A6D3C9_ZASCE|nr:uncharacterized protein M409DRAFT_49413 [Zasmidium cellare ATCC 36951]KAF2172900.1 hypothetical protein M409DRAFT_49413 [Zasmidium cellare ATCC 36951]
MTKHTIVALDSWVSLPALNFEYELIRHVNTSPMELPERMKDATIVVTSATRVTRAGIENAPRLKLIACNGTGTDHVDKAYARERNITVCHVPAQNTDSVSEHAFALYYAVRRKIIPLHNIAMDGTTWAQDNMLHGRFGPPPRTNSEETLVVVGYGALGKNVERIGTALGMRVLVAERKGASQVRRGRVSFQNALSEGTVFIIVAPSDASTRDMFANPEFEAMNSSAVIINVGRGGVINEHDLANALREGRIGGAATDVFEHEPATRENSPLIDPSIPNLVLSPHLAWYASKTIKNTIASVKTNLEAFAAGNPQNVVVASQ